MTTFDDRKSAFENKFKHDQELQFKVQNRRNKLLGLWAAEQLGIHGSEAEAYAKQVVMADFEKAGDQDVIDKVLADFKAKSIDMTEHRLRRHLDECAAEARAQIQKEI